MGEKNKLTEEEFKKIFKDTESKWEGDNCYQGLQIIAKYTETIIEGADYGVLYSENIDTLIEAGITKKEVKKLASLNWSIKDGYFLACFV